MNELINQINWGCHGIPERCFLINGKRMRICARCVGGNIGHIITIILFYFDKLPKWYFSILLFSIMLTDWTLQQYFNILSNNTRRLMTGILGGIGFASLIWSGILVVFLFIKNSL